MSKTFLKVWNTVTTILVVLIVVLAILLVGVRLAGFQVFTVLSGSMEPTYHTGSLIYVKEAAEEDIQVGDPITFLLAENTVATHRVVDISRNEEGIPQYTTKGDANNSADGRPVDYRNVIGKPVFSIPGLGYVAEFIQHPPGSYAAICGGLVLLILIFLPDLMGGRKKESGQTPEKQ